ncbi:MAG TPA: hypothetical protein VFW13_00845 [Phenylobacterium sp.]|nr:hypothetical protein [Phenylobacterium sp.]
MPRYQLYLFDDGGRIKEAVAFDVADDSEAKDYAEEQRERRAMELWSSGRVVEQYPSRA